MTEHRDCRAAEAWESDAGAQAKKAEAASSTYIVKRGGGNSVASRGCVKVAMHHGPFQKKEKLSWRLEQ